MSHQPPSGIAADTSQSGSILVIMAASMILLLVVLGSVQLGYASYMKRELQKAADLGALSGVQMLKDGTECDAAIARAREVAAANVSGLDAVTPECGAWKVPAGYTAGADKALFFDTSAPLRNALRVSVDKNIGAIVPFFSNGINIVGVSAIAITTEPVAAFSVGSRLLRVRQNGLLGKVLTGVGASPEQLTVLDSEGLLTAKITPAGLLAALGLPVDVELHGGSPTEVLLVDVLDATATVMSQSEVAAVDITGLRQLSDALRITDLNIPIKLFGEGGIMALADSGNPTSALDARVSVSDLVATSIVIANGRNAVNLPLAISTPFLNLNAKAYIVSPPAIGIGGIGTQAHAAQVQVALRAKTPDTLSIGSVDLHLVLEIAQSTGTLTNMACTSNPSESRAEIGVTASAIKLCLAPPDGASANACVPVNNPPRYPMLSLLGLLGINLATIHIPAPLTVLAVGESTSPPSWMTVGSTDSFPSTGPIIDIDTVTDALVKIIKANAGLVGGLLVGALDTLLIKTLGLANLATPVLNAALNQLLNILGLSLAETDVTLYSVQCGVPRLAE